MRLYKRCQALPPSTGPPRKADPNPLCRDPYPNVDYSQLARCSTKLQPTSCKPAAPRNATAAGIRPTAYRAIPGWLQSGGCASEIQHTYAGVPESAGKTDLRPVIRAFNY